MDESRKQFEAEMEKLGDCVDMRRAKNGDEEYMAWDVALAWRFWNLSRAAIEIKLPTELQLKKYACSDCISVTLDEVENSIRAAGIKVKE